ncbi:hypothetical protein [Flectobacillus longus]|uniref:hypothetical protein n=1 Tax=Flectobacillus longus TaxID=2984207 RepID=UPI0024B7F1EB|nr:hypothetical protein [Flectobacillus longus]MDI9880054.1 hypothetical protein [Flectobacillus longus]
MLPRTNNIFCKYILLLLLLPNISWGQNRFFVPHNTLTFGIGSSSYYGDLSSYSRPIQSTLDEVRWNVGGYYTHYFTSRWGARVGLRYVRIAGNDFNMQGVDGKLDRFARNLHFRNDLKELSAVGIYNLNPAPRYYNKRQAFSTYLLGGIAVFLHDPMAKTPTGEWVKLRPLNTEGQGLPGYDSPYKAWAAAGVAGAGVRFKLNDQWDLGLEGLLQYSFTDYLDDIKGSYANPNDLAIYGNLTVTMANRSREGVDAYTGKNRTTGIREYVLDKQPNFDPSQDPFTSATMQNYGQTGQLRGSSQLKDSYMTMSIHLIYHLPNGIRCPSY